MSVAESMVILAPIDQLGWRKRLRRRGTRQTLRAPGAERAARCREHDRLDALGLRAGERLQCRGVLAVDGKKLGAGLRDGRHEHLARGHEAFLVGERQAPALPRRLERRLEPGRADDRRQHAVGRLGGSGNDGSGPGGDSCCGPGKQRLELAVEPRIADHGEAGVGLARGLGELGDAALRGDCHDLEGIGVVRDEIEGASADGAGRAEDGQAFARRRRLLSPRRA